MRSGVVDCQAKLATLNEQCQDRAGDCSVSLFLIAASDSVSLAKKSLRVQLDGDIGESQKPDKICAQSWAADRSGRFRFGSSWLRNGGLVALDDARARVQRCADAT